MKGITVAVFFVMVVVAAPVAYGQRTAVEVDCGITEPARGLCSQVKSAINRDGTWSQTKRGSRYQVVLTASSVPIPCDNLDIIAVGVSYNVFLDGLSERFPHNLATEAFPMDERGRVVSFASWAEGTVDNLNFIRDFFEANANAASPEDIPAFELKERTQLELSQR